MPTHLAKNVLFVAESSDADRRTLGVFLASSDLDLDALTARFAAESVPDAAFPDEGYPAAFIAWMVGEGLVERVPASKLTLRMPVVPEASPARTEAAVVPPRSLADVIQAAIQEAEKAAT